ncbi:hypothetical protein SS50377_21901 [Spironucleus salmonicida]|uniref:Uncharacterized protein n=1 Tax=Spironucleus salmonicida TaxID=348837 RepID=V6LIQ9_9EUKA|nr:hypothetical protein SS50377_21901 [Spironucleus salmonicida]|eukprot:EST44442.1 Hypothetical protein SS50377_15750 [Spironucleus salmonicida]
MCKTYGDIEFQYSSMQTDSDMRPYAGEPFQQPSTIIITKCVTGAYLQCDLSNIKKILVKCSLPSNHLIVNIPSLRHLELVNTKLQIIDAFHAQKLVSLKIKDPLTNLRLVSLPKALESLYIDTRDAMIYPDIEKRQIDYLYLSNVQCYYNPQSPTVAIYFDLKKLRFAPVAGSALADTIPAVLPQQPSNLQTLFRLHQRFLKLGVLEGNLQDEDSIDSNCNDDATRINQLEAQKSLVMKRLSYLRAPSSQVFPQMMASTSSIFVNNIIEPSSLDSDE